MSNALLTVTFKRDGHKLYGQYQGSTDTWYRNLFETPEEARSHSRHNPGGVAALNYGRVAIDPEEAEISSSYGGGFVCDPNAMACRKARVVTSDCFDKECY